MFLKLINFQSFSRAWKLEGKSSTFINTEVSSGELFTSCVKVLTCCNYPTEACFLSRTVKTFIYLKKARQTLQWNKQGQEAVISFMLL